MILYLDTNVLVYRFASSAKLKAHAREWLDWHGRQPGSLLVTSRLTVLEALVGPLRKSDLVRQKLTEDALAEILILDMDDAVVRRAAAIRAHSHLRSPDALHLATALEAQADIFLTADRRLKSFKDIRVMDALRDRPGSLEKPAS